MGTDGFAVAKTKYLSTSFRLGRIQFVPRRPTPLASVVIPTTGHRPNLLHRAVRTALEGPFHASTEVLVVLNGPRSVDLDLPDDPRIVRLRVTAADQNSARNHGLAHAKGEFVRFLDDDDYLLPAPASAQYEWMLESSLDVCSAAISVEDQTGTVLGRLIQPDVSSFLEAALHHTRLQLPLAHVYRRRAIQCVSWPIGMRQSEDNVWLLRCASQKDLSWGRMEEAVGVWYQHQSPRMSSPHPSSQAYEHTVEAIIEATAVLVEQRRWTPALARITSNALWQCIHKAFHLRPPYWAAVAAKATMLDPAGRPDFPIYRHPVIQRINPITLQWLLLPKRSLEHWTRHVRGQLFGWDYRRQM